MIVIYAVIASCDVMNSYKKSVRLKAVSSK